MRHNQISFQHEIDPSELKGGVKRPTQELFIRLSAKDVLEVGCFCLVSEWPTSSNRFGLLFACWIVKKREEKI